MKKQYIVQKLLTMSLQDLHQLYHYVDKRDLYGGAQSPNYDTLFEHPKIAKLFLLLLKEHNGVGFIRLTQKIKSESDDEVIKQLLYLIIKKNESHLSEDIHSYNNAVTNVDGKLIKDWILAINEQNKKLVIARLDARIKLFIEDKKYDKLKKRREKLHNNLHGNSALAIRRRQAKEGKRRLSTTDHDEINNFEHELTILNSKEIEILKELESLRNKIRDL